MGAFETERVALLSIRPDFARAIFAGQKTVEFRRSRLPDDITTVLVYATRPVGLVLGWFTIAGIRESTPDGLWRRFRSSGAIGRSAYFEYFEGSRRAFGIEIGEPTPLGRPLPLHEFLPGLRPSQSVQYLGANEVQEAIRSCEGKRWAQAQLQPVLAV